MIDQRKFERELIKHKRAINYACIKFKEKPKEGDNIYPVTKVIQQSKKLALVAADFKCMKCGAEERLSWHHLVLKKAKFFMPFDRYLSARHYWNNILVLCWPCHYEYHDKDRNIIHSKETDISKRYIEKLKKEFCKK